jgi:hypothetical protein
MIWKVFNKALLAKQCLRLLQNPKSLAAKILKVKYYPHCSILDAQLENRPSYIWRSIWLPKLTSYLLSNRQDDC